jgi:hypothetical protein
MKISMHQDRNYVCRGDERHKHYEQRWRRRTSQEGGKDVTYPSQMILVPTSAIIIIVLIKIQSNNQHYEEELFVSKAQRRNN